MYEIFTTGGDVHSTTAVTIWNNKFPDKKTDIDTFQRLRKVSETFRDKDGNIDYKKIDDDIHLDRALKEGIILTKDRDTLIKEIELGLEYEKMRGKAKAVNFSIVYGTTPIGLAENLEITEEEAMMYIQSYKQTYPGVAKWMEETKKQVREKMYVETLLGRKRRLYPEVTSGQQWLLESAYRVGMNSPIQGCLDIETPILTTEGYVPIKDITNHELVTFSGTTKDYKVWNSGEKKLYRLNTLHTSIDATAEHRFAIYDKGELIFVPLESLKVGDIIAIANYTPKVAVTDNDMTIHEFLGAIIGDGSYTNNRDISISGGRKKLSYLKEIDSYLRTNYNLTKQKIERSRGSVGEAYVLVINNKNFRDMLKELGLTQVSGKNKIIPEWYLTAPTDVRCQILRGLFNADGGWSSNTLTFTSISRDVSFKVYLLLESLGIRARFRETEEGVFRTFVDLNSYKRFNELIGFKIKHKQDRLNKYLNLKTRSLVPRDLIMDVYKVLRKDKELFKKLTASERSHVYRFKQGSATKDSCLKYLKMCEETEEVNRFIYLLDTISFTKITSIEDLGVRPTMDIEIFTEDHSYIASNFMCHNSAADMTKKATIDLQPALKKYDCNILLWVHDEIILDIPEDLGMEPLKEFAEIMCNAIPLKCGMKSDIEISERWGQKMNEDDLKELWGEEDV